MRFIDCKILARDFKQMILGGQETLTLSIDNNSAQVKIPQSLKEEVENANLGVDDSLVIIFDLLEERIESVSVVEYVEVKIYPSTKRGTDA